VRREARVRAAEKKDRMREDWGTRRSGRVAAMNRWVRRLPGWGVFSVGLWLVMVWSGSQPDGLWYRAWTGQSRLFNRTVLSSERAS
jgi:hypothetical protein